MAQFDEIYLEGRKNTITYPASIFIPASVMHAPLNIKKVKKPFMFIDITFSPGPSVRPVPRASSPSLHGTPAGSVPAATRRSRRV